MAHSEDDGKYRPTETPLTTNAILRTIPTTRRPIIPPVVPAWNTPRAYPGWNDNRQGWNDNRQGWNQQGWNRYDTRYNPNGRKIENL